MPEITKSRYMVQAGWNDVPHLDAKTKAELLASYQEFEREARTQGIPSLGAGAIYPIHPDDITCAPFPIPKYWPRCYGFDPGWKCTAAVWLALDPETDTAYAYAEHYRGKVEPTIHASAVKARGEWIPGAIDWAGMNIDDGKRIMLVYRDLGLRVVPADKSVEAGIYEVLTRLSTGRLKVFSTCQNFLREYRLYRRDESHKVVKEYDHAMDALRYAVVTGLRIAKVMPPKTTGSRGDFATGDRTAGY
jgi:hypothetical protein